MSQQTPKSEDDEVWYSGDFQKDADNAFNKMKKSMAALKSTNQQAEPFVDKLLAQYPPRTSSFSGLKLVTTRTNAPQKGRTIIPDRKGHAGSSSSAALNISTSAFQGSSFSAHGSSPSAGRYSPVKSALSALTLSEPTGPTTARSDSEPAEEDWFQDLPTFDGEDEDIGHEPVLPFDQTRDMSEDMDMDEPPAQVEPAAEKTSSLFSLSELDSPPLSSPPHSPEQTTRKRHSDKPLGRPRKKPRKALPIKTPLPIRVMAPSGNRFVAPSTLPASTLSVLKETNMDMSSNHVEWREYTSMVERKGREVNSSHPACICCIVDGKRRGLCDIGSDPSHACSRCAKEMLPCAKMIEDESGQFHAGSVPLRPQHRANATQWKDIGFWRTDQTLANAVDAPPPVTTKGVKQLEQTMGSTRQKRTTANMLDAPNASTAGPLQPAIAPPTENDRDEPEEPVEPQSEDVLSAYFRRHGRFQEKALNQLQLQSQLAMAAAWVTDKPDPEIVELEAELAQICEIEAIVTDTVGSIEAQTTVLAELHPGAEMEEIIDERARAEIELAKAKERIAELERQLQKPPI
ncbi:hypothetical protein BDV96DRAFT_607211 [Lophiotrema nucula]|uniref:Uncharacterized protein n=1 Tax=Lophiotrema nucula TaxID=690887 RepID=A0A6A5YHL8_9PLEO|nr:hypothetical protein BDV96DRAFT_607211 [Lophiotrema nucula]